MWEPDSSTGSWEPPKLGPCPLLAAVLLGTPGSGTALAGCTDVIHHYRRELISAEIATTVIFPFPPSDPNEEIVVAMRVMKVVPNTRSLDSMARGVLSGKVRAETLAEYIAAFEFPKAKGLADETAKILVELAERDHHDLALAIYKMVAKCDSDRAKEDTIEELMFAAIAHEGTNWLASARVMRLGNMLFKQTMTRDDDKAGWVTVVYNKLSDTRRADAATDIPDIKNKSDADLVLVFRHIWPHFRKFRAACAADTGFMLRMLLCNVASLRAFETRALVDEWDIVQHAKGLVDALGEGRSVAAEAKAAAKAEAAEAKAADGICTLSTGALRNAIGAEISGRTAWPSDALLRVIRHHNLRDDRTHTTGFLDMTVTAANSADLAFFLVTVCLGEDDKVIDAAIKASKNGFTDVGAALLRAATEKALRKKLAKLAPAEQVHLVVCAGILPYLGPVEALARKWYRNEAGQRTFQALKLLQTCALSEKEVGPYIAMAMKRGGALAQQATQLASVLSSSSFGLLGSFLYTE